MVIFIKKFGTILISHPSGREAWLAFQPVLRDVTETEDVIVDFTGVEVLTPSWADEFLLLFVTGSAVAYDLSTRIIHLFKQRSRFCELRCVAFLRYNGSMKTKQFTSTEVKKIADLARIPVSKTEEQTLASGFSTTLTVVDKMVAIDVKGVEPTSQVTGLENVFREDEIDTTRMFSQEQALSNAKRTHNDFFVTQK